MIAPPRANPAPHWGRGRIAMPRHYRNGKFPGDCVEVIRYNRDRGMPQQRGHACMPPKASELFKGFLRSPFFYLNDKGQITLYPAGQARKKGNCPERSPRSFLLTQERDIYVIYEAAIVKDEYDEFKEPYLPARYKEVVRKKKQRRLLKKIGMIAITFIALVVVFILISGFFSGTAQPAPTPTPAVTSLPIPATAPPAATTIPTITPVKTTLAPTETILKPDTITTVTTTETPEPVLTASANTYITPTGDTAPTITEKQAQAIALAAFPDQPAGSMSVELATSPDFGRVWKYTLRADTTVEASGLLDAETGMIDTYNRTIQQGGRPQNPVLTLGNARQIADSTINNRNNGILSINMSDGHYIPLSTQSGNVAGSYRFVYNRIIQDYPCDVDGFIVSVDAVTGAITEYLQHWQTPDNAFMVLEDPVVPKYDATYTVQAKAKSIYPASVPGLRILSADRRWKDKHDPATTPRPSSIPLAWKVVFDDDTLRASGASPAVCWVDASSGEIIEITYKH